MNNIAYKYGHFEIVLGFVYFTQDLKNKIKRKLFEIYTRHKPNTIL